MKTQQFKDALLSQAMTSCPELNIEWDEDQEAWYWSFRCIDSRDLEREFYNRYDVQKASFFVTPIHALAHFAGWLIKSMDAETQEYDPDFENELL